MRFGKGETDRYPPFVEHYFTERDKAMLREHGMAVEEAMRLGGDLPDFPDALLAEGLDNTWRDTAHAVVGNWVGLVYRVTHSDRRRPFMEGIRPEDPLGLST